MLSTSSASKLSIKPLNPSTSSGNGTHVSNASQEESPQSFWLNSFQRQAGSGFATGQFASANDFKKSLLSDLARAMEQFPVDKFRTDYYFLLIWLAYINLQFELHGDEDDCRKMFKMMKSSHIGLQHPEFFLHWAAFELSVERKGKALTALASAEDLPVLRGNGQIREAKERVEAGKALSLDPLYKLNTAAPAATSHLAAMDVDYPSTRLVPGTARSFTAMTHDYSMHSSGITGGVMDLRTPSSTNSDANYLMEDDDKTAARLRRIGLGPPKRINVDPHVEYDVAIEEDKPSVGKDKENRPHLPSLLGSAAAEDAASETNNSNMSLTMTEINVGLIETVVPLPAADSKEVVANLFPIPVSVPARGSAADAPQTALSDTATLNMTNASVLNVLPIREQSQSNSASAAVAATAPSTAAIKSRQVRVNGKVYRVLQLIGRGGSSKVFQVINADGRIFALKKVNLKNLDEGTVNGYANEIQLLRSFSGCPHIIQLVDSELSRESGCLYILMEYGEVDLGRMLKQRTGVDENFIRFAWQQMIQAVQAVHEAKIVHCDLKPANFLLVQGSLKLIDFGISKAILNDTTNIVRENQVGTVNYMSPEALQESSTAMAHDRGRLKIGRPSDIWSLGCILYEMLHGRPPFAHFQTLIQRLHKILDPAYDIEYPTTDRDRTNTDLLATIKGCLVRGPKDRLTLAQLLVHPFLRPAPSLQTDSVIVSRSQIHSLLQKFAEAYPGLNPSLLSDRIFQQWLSEQQQ